MTALYEQIRAETAVSDQALVALPRPVRTATLAPLPTITPPAPAVTPPTHESRPVFAQKVDWGEMPRPTFLPVAR